MSKQKIKNVPADPPPVLPIEDQAPWGPVSAVLVTILGYFGGQIFGPLLLVLGLAIFGMQFENAADWISDSPAGLFVAILFIGIISLGILYIFLKSRGAKLYQLGIVSPKIIDIGYSLAGFGVYFLINIIAVIAVNALLPSVDTSQKQELGFSTSTQGFELIFVFLSLVILPPLIEEIYTRGFLYSGLATKLPKIFAAIVTSAMFAVAHLQFGSGNNLLWVAAIDTFILSMVLIYLREKTGSLWSPIGVHFLKNLLAFLALFVFRVV